MIGWIAASSVLIGLVLLVRVFARGRISLRLQYALWLLVLVRLLLPFNLTGSPLSVLNALPAASRGAPAALHTGENNARLPAAQRQDAPSDAGDPAAKPAGAFDKAALLPGGADDGTAAAAPEAPSAPPLTAEELLRLVWLAGAAVTAGAFLLTNLLFARRLRRSRTPFETAETRLPVYLAEGLPSPCLFGLFHPAIYLTAPAAENPVRLHHILTHEETHFRHGDHWWSLARCAALVLHWYNPLVWLAAVLSRRDGELACDEAAVRRLGEEQRLSYGRTLLDMVCAEREPAGIFGCATTMTSGKRSLKERITLLTRHPKTAAASLVCLLLALSLAVSCTFTGAKPAVSQSAAPADVPEGYTLTAAAPLDDVQAYTPADTEPSWISAAQLPSASGYMSELPLRDGQEVLCYQDTDGSKYWALRNGDTVTRFAQEENSYTEGYSAEAFEDVFGHSGFRIVCPRGAAYTAYDYYYLDKDGLPRLLAECSNSVTEADLNGDGEKELLWHYHANESYLYFRRDGKIWQADVNGLVQGVLPEWTISDVREYDLDAGLLPVFYQTGGSSAERRAYLRFTPDAVQVLEKQRLPGEMTVYDCGGVKIGLPKKYTDQLIVRTDFTSDDYSTAAGGTPLIKVSEKASVEAGKAEGISDGVGWLFTISRLTRAQYEQYILGDRSEQAAFAASGKADAGRYTAPVYDTYYVLSGASDVQFYRSGAALTIDSPEWKNWEELWDVRYDVQEDMITRSGLTAYADSDFLGQDFTYDSGHAYVKYYPYYTFDGSTAQYDTLVLSQPQKQGEGGVWCVERWYDEYGSCYPYFPGADAGGSGTAAEYCARLQRACDTAAKTDTEEAQQLTPMGAAKRFVENSGWYSRPGTAEGSFAQTDKLNTAYWEQNVRVQQLALDLKVGRAVDAGELLSCAGDFTADTWGVLGRGLYGSDWWTPMKTALIRAAGGEEQDTRDLELLRFYLSYSREEGAVAEGLREILAAAERADPMIFNKTLSGACTAEEQSRVRSALAGI
ncbi:MAG: M56 family metallopeptidase [Oscillibacter sp.]|jgi:beta-lactamase regulating signal transducer with metallopeptidase domain|nr:M56 family metallopeptidase [Oscillibacter sp.]